MAKTKKCIACNETKPANTIFFYKQKRLKFGLSCYCKLCQAKKAKKYYIKYSEKKRDERAVTLNTYSKTEMFYNNNMLVNYALTREKYRAILKKQDYKCASCGIKIKINRIKTSRIDYDRGLNKVRGIVCKHCYTLLDCFKGDLSRLKDCVKYIRNF